MLCGAFVAAGCAHAPASDALATRRLLVLERDFKVFVATPLHNRDEVEQQTATLESLRLLYLDALAHTDTPTDHVLALVRIAELHLDLGARIRRLPYPAQSTRRERRAFDATLSQLALPLEAVGRGVLTQAVDYASDRGLDNRFVHRARLYQALHAAEGLTAPELAWLRKELRPKLGAVGDGQFDAPRTLLEVGRVGQSASR